MSNYMYGAARQRFQRQRGRGGQNLCSDAMSQASDFIAIDLGASSGRVMLRRWDGRRFGLHELHRFPNGPVSVMGRQHWDVLHL
jgi:hypothetical protein